MITTLKYKMGKDGHLRRYTTYINLLNKSYRIKVFPVNNLNTNTGGKKLKWIMKTN